MDLRQIMDFLLGLAKAFSEVLFKAVVDYPTPTVLVLLAVVFALQQTNLYKVYDREKKRLKAPHGVEWAYCILGLIVVVVLANFIGSTSYPFKRHPLEFTIILLLLSFVAFIYLLIKAEWQIRNANPLLSIVLAICVLFGAYVSTQLYVAIRGDKAQAAPLEDGK